MFIKTNAALKSVWRKKSSEILVSMIVNIKIIPNWNKRVQRFEIER